MEVHHHSHSSSLPAGQAGKKWTHYFWEFLMLFLAVFCGFLAEYQLEHVIEHQREKQFAKQLLDDLRADSAFFTKRIEILNTKFEKNNKFYQLMTATVKPSDKEILNSCLPLLRTHNVYATTGTYNQMKASGGLRYIKDQTLTNELQKYYEVLLPREITNSEFQTNYYGSNIAPFVLKHFRAQDQAVGGDSVKVSDPVILNRTTQTDQELLNIIDTYANEYRSIYENITLPTAAKINDLIVLLKQEYHLQ